MSPAVSTESAIVRPGRAERVIAPCAAPGLLVAMRCVTLVSRRRWCWTLVRLGGTRNRLVIRSSPRSGFRGDRRRAGASASVQASQLSSPRKRGPILRGPSIVFGLWVPALAALGRDDSGERRQ